jgi:hypothetical protein
LTKKKKFYNTGHQDITYDLANVFGMLGEDPGDEGYDDPYEEESQTVQTIILPGTDLVSCFFSNSVEFS